MSELESSARKVESWLQPLADEALPCGPDLEYDNDFLALNQAVAGKPETQFGPAEAPDWRAALSLADSLLDRSRDLRVAIVWLRAGLHTWGFAFLPAGLSLLVGLAESMWEQVHPLPDPEDNDPYARVNALSSLADPEGLIGDLRSVHIVNDRSIGELTWRGVEVALGLLPAHGDEAELGREQVALMVAAAVAKTPQLREAAEQSEQLFGRLTMLVNDRLGTSVAPDLRPLAKSIASVVTVLPSISGTASPEADAAQGLAAADGDGGVRGLSGAVRSRDEAVRAIDLVCEYLERTEPTNPAPLFLRRARHLIGHNFLQLMKELAPEALAEVARVVGVDPESVETPGGT
jgi:type VI secretion system protein ImpA